MPEGSAIAIEGLSKSYGNGPTVLHDIHLQAAKGEIITIVGPSGCGKSTFLRLLGGLIHPTSGSIRFSDAETRPAFIFQDPTLLPWATVADNVALPLRLNGVSKDERLTVAKSWLKRLGLEARALDLPRQLSGGMRMRASIARALALRPSLLLLDEPFAALDALSRNRLNEILVDLHQEAKWNAFFVTHSVSEAVFLGHRVLVLSRHGSLLESISIPLPQPRSSSIRETPAFHEIVARVTAHLQSILPDASL